MSPAGARAFPARRVVPLPRSVPARPAWPSAWSRDAPHETHDLAQDPYVAAADRFHFGVLGLQPNMVRLLEETLDRRLLADERDDDLAVGGRLLAAHHDKVALHDAYLLHRLPSHTEQVF